MGDYRYLMAKIIPALLFTLLSLAPVCAAEPPAPVPKTGQTACYNATGSAVIPCARTGQDGDTVTGVDWPTPRFLDNGDQTITDKLTGLIWTRTANPSDRPKNWQQALDYVKTLNNRNYLGQNDWRLPNVNELESLVIKRPDLTAWLKTQGFANIMADHYWTSTTYASYTAYAWSISMTKGLVAGTGKAENGYVWPVRNGKPGTLCLAKTGQTACYDNVGTATACAGTGQDGEVQAGAAWPNPRFTDNGDETMTDRLTGLVWPKYAKAPGPAVCSPGTYKTWQGALDHVKCLNAMRYLGRNDWRLPNRNELASLINHGQPNNALWLSTVGFSDVQTYSYYSSSTFADVDWNAWSMGMQDGAVTSNAKMRAINAWPVRSGR